MVLFASRDAMPAEAQSALEALAYRWGETYDAYLVTEGEREYFWLPDWQGVAAFTRRGRSVLVVGGLLAPPDLRAALLDALIAEAKTKRWNLSFYNIGGSETGPFRDAGCQITKMGEEPIIELDRTEWQGKAYEWVRRQENYCKRLGVTLAEVRHDDPDYPRIAVEVEAVSQAHLADTIHGRELQFFVGSFDPARLGNRRLFIARLDGRVIAFVVCNPCLAGAMWAVEIYRKLPDAPRGVVPYAIMRTLRILKAEGVRMASLSLVPLVRSFEPDMEEGSRLFYWTARLWWKRLNWLFDMQGIYHFKSRFRPAYREMHLVAYPKITVRSLVATALTWEVLRVNPLRLMRRRGGGRATLARPPSRPERVVWDLRAEGSGERVASPHRGAVDDGAADGAPQEARA